MLLMQLYNTDASYTGRCKRTQYSSTPTSEVLYCVDASYHGHLERVDLAHLGEAPSICIQITMECMVIIGISILAELYTSCMHNDRPSKSVPTSTMGILSCHAMSISCSVTFPTSTESSKPSTIAAHLENHQ